MKELSQLTIGKVAKMADVGVETIRFYERKQIIAQPTKRAGFRYYSVHDVRNIRLIKKLQGVGFTLEEIKPFLEFDQCCGDSRHVIRQKSLSKIDELNQKIVDLASAVNALQQFSNSCGADNNPSTGCDLLDCFDNEWACCNQPDSITGE